MNSIFSAWLIWFIAGIGLALLELLLPGFVILFMGLGCIIVAGLLLFLPLTLTQQFLVFIISTIILIVLLRKWLMNTFKGLSYGGSEPDYDDFPNGARVKVVKTISPQNNGRIHFRGTLWDAASDEVIENDEMAEIIRFADNSRQIYFVKKL